MNQTEPDKSVPAKKPSKKKRTNPFYVMLIVVGLAFCLTASSFGMLMLRDMRSTSTYAYDEEEVSASEASFVELVDRYAVQLLTGELVLLAIATFGAIGTDSYWSDD